MAGRFLYLSFCILLFGCGQNIRPKTLDEPCTRSGQCEAGLVCQAGVCLPMPDAGVDAGDGGP